MKYFQIVLFKAISCLFLISFNLVSAQEIISLNHSLTRVLDHEFNVVENSFHTGFKPYIVHPTMNIKPDSVFLLNRRKNSSEQGYLMRKLRYEHFIAVDTQDFKLNVDPLFNFEGGRSFNESLNIFNNTRGFLITGGLGSNFYFESSFYENQSRFPEYINAEIRQTNVAPGQGWVKPFKTDGYDYAFASGLISYSPGKSFNFQFGHGKNFIGDGYRSLLLSDNSFNYPFLKITTTIWKFQYTNLFATFMDPKAPHTYEGGFQKKRASFHYLSINLLSWIQVGLFESIIWQDSDSVGRRGYDLNYFNPVIFYRPVEYSLGSPDNAVIGGNLKVKVTSNLSLYGQLVIDDLDIAGAKKGSGYLLSKYGFQAGFKWFDFLTVPGLYAQGEWNQVQPYVYAHKVPKQNYSHYNQALAHPLGANFREVVGILNYKWRDISAEWQMNYAQYGADTNGTHWGKNIFLSDFYAQRGYPSYGNKLLQGVKTTLTWQMFTLRYIINPNANMNLYVRVSSRNEKSSLNESQSRFISFGIATSLQNLYYDF